MTSPLRSLLPSARWYLSHGLNIVACDQNKTAIVKWKEFQSRMITIDEFKHQSESPKAAGIAVICGQISGNLEVIDIDCKYDITGTLYEDLKSHIPFFERLYVTQTRSKGYHLYYRCEAIDGNRKLASRPSTDEERIATPHLRSVTIIETRGEAGYVIGPPSDGYRVIQRNDIPILTSDEREIIIEACRSFNTYMEPVVIPLESRADSSNYHLSPGDDYNKRGDVIALLESHGWTVVRRTEDKIILKRPGQTDSKSSGDFLISKGWLTIFSTNTPFEPLKAYSPFAVYAILEHKGNFRDAARDLGSKGFGERLDSKKKLHLASDPIETFWKVNDRKIKILKTALEQFISRSGFKLYQYSNDSAIHKLIFLKDGIAEDATIADIKQFIKKYIASLPDNFDGITPNMLLEEVYQKVESLFSKNFMEMLDKVQLDFLKDDKTTAYFPFRNGIVKIQAGHDPVLLNYGEVNKVIWKRQIRDFDIILTEQGDVEYLKFLSNVMGNNPDRIKYAVSLIGYLLHSYKDPSRPFATILAEETDDEKKGGGTGKGLFMKAIGHMVPVLPIDGKNFKADKSFLWQRAGLDTKLIVIEDCEKRVDFEKFYSIITEGITIEKKQKDELFIPFEDSPKIAFTTNYSIAQSSGHAKRRQKVIEFAAHYSSDYTPAIEFNKILFTDWDIHEWNRFYNFMVGCCLIYLEAGIMENGSSMSMRRKHIKLSFGEEFLEWFEDLTTDHWYQFSQEYNSFLAANGMDRKDYSSKRFRTAIVETDGKLGFKVEMRRNRQNNNLNELRKTSI
jgi:hypothetical protein